MKYFLKVFNIFIVNYWFLYIVVDKNINDLSGQEVESTVNFVYEAF